MNHDELVAHLSALPDADLLAVVVDALNSRPDAGRAGVNCWTLTDVDDERYDLTLAPTEDWEF